MADEEDHDPMEVGVVVGGGGGGDVDFFHHEPTKSEKIEMRKAVKSPSEWLKLLCNQWADENQALVETTDAKLLEYKPYLKGMLSSQLLCRLSIPSTKDSGLDASPPFVDFWRILGIEDEFDRAYIIAQIERFCSHYNVRGTIMDEDSLFGGEYHGTETSSLEEAAGAGLVVLPPYMDHLASPTTVLSKKQTIELSKAHQMAKDAEKTLELGHKNNMKREPKRVVQHRKESKAREKEDYAVRKAQERTAREASREERRQRKVIIREQREQRAKELKEAALKRAAELVSSNRVPIEITRGAAAAKAAANAAMVAVGTPPVKDEDYSSDGRKKPRSAIVVSTAGDLHRICIHAKALFAKYSAIAKEHNQKVNWMTVAKELGIHVKVREKYSRMYARAISRGFDFEKCADWKIKDYPEIFLEPTKQEQQSKMPSSVSVDATGSVIVPMQGEKESDNSDEAVPGAAGCGDSGPKAVLDTVVPPTEEQTAAAEAVVAATMAHPIEETVDL